MKLKRLLSCALALVLALGLAATPAAAATFPDIASHWAKTYIEEMTTKGMFKGYDDGTFKPENQLTTAEALALCARTIGLSDSIGAEIFEDRREDVDAILKGSQNWFYREFAICMEAGILSYSDLKGLFQSGALTKPIAKEDLAVYLVRAMQLGPMAERLPSYTLTFSDVDAIAMEKQPYVYVLSMYGIVQGDQSNAFTPKTYVNRAVMSTMLSRALSFMQEQGIEADLPEYTRYDFQQGTVTAVTTGDKGVTLLTLNHDLTNAPFSVSVSSDVPVFKNNMKSATSSGLKGGAHVRICYNGRGDVTEIRVSDALDTYTGAVNGIDGNNIAMTVNGSGMIFNMTRYTQVQVGTKTPGNRTTVDATAGYSAAVCLVDDQNRLVGVQFTGGTRSEQGLVASAERVAGNMGNTTLRVIGFDGVTHQYTVPSGATVMVNGVEGTLTGNYAGCYVNLRVSNDDGTVAAATVDTVTKYVQGAVKGSTWQSNPNTMSISDISTNKSTSYNIASNAVLTYNGDTVALRDLKKDWFVTARLNGGSLVTIECYPGSVVTEGILTGRSFGTGSSTNATLEVTKKDETVVNYTIDMANPPTMKRDGSSSTIDKLRVGDEVVITVRYSTVSTIEATPQTANMIATIDRIIQEKGGSTLELTLTDGAEVSYHITSSASVTQGGKEVGIAALKPGFRVGLVVNGDQIASVEIQQTVDSGGQLNGTVVFVNTSEKTILLRAIDEAGNENLVTVNVPSATNILDWEGSGLYLRELSPGDSVQINGAYSGAEFNAKLILRR